MEHTLSATLVNIKDLIFKWPLIACVHVVCILCIMYYVHMNTNVCIDYHNLTRCVCCVDERKAAQGQGHCLILVVEGFVVKVNTFFDEISIFVYACYRPG